MIRCLETRKLKLPTVTIKWRRYRDDDGNSTATCEVPTALWNKLATQCGETELVVKRSVVGNVTVMHEKIVELLNKGWKVVAIAHELKVSETAVYNQKKRIQNEPR